MNFVFCKLKRFTQKPYRKLLSNTTLYVAPDWQNITFVKYNIDYKLDDDEWFCIDEFSNMDFCPDILKSDIQSTDHAEFKEEKLQDIAWIACLQGDDVHFQRVPPFKKIKNSGFFKLGEEVKFVTEMSSILVNDNPDAVYIRSLDKLVFRRLASITNIFKNIAEIEREATLDDVNKVFGLEFVKINEAFTADLVSRPNLKRVTTVMSRLDAMDDEFRASITSYQKKYCKNLKVCEQSGVFLVSNDIEFKEFLHGLDERFHETEVTKMVRLANSVTSYN